MSSSNKEWWQKVFSKAKNLQVLESGGTVAQTTALKGTTKSGSCNHFQDQNKQEHSQCAAVLDDEADDFDGLFAYDNDHFNWEKCCKEEEQITTKEYQPAYNDVWQSSFCGGIVSMWSSSNKHTQQATRQEFAEKVTLMKSKWDQMAALSQQHHLIVDSNEEQDFKPKQRLSVFSQRAALCPFDDQFLMGLGPSEDSQGSSSEKECSKQIGMIQQEQYEQKPTVQNQVVSDSVNVAQPSKNVKSLPAPLFFQTLAPFEKEQDVNKSGNDDKREAFKLRSPSTTVSIETVGETPSKPFNKQAAQALQFEGLGVAQNQERRKRIFSSSDAHEVNQSDLRGVHLEFPSKKFDVSSSGSQMSTNAADFVPSAFPSSVSETPTRVEQFNFTSQPFVPSSAFHLGSKSFVPESAYSDQNSELSKFEIMRKTEICTKWEQGFCNWGDKCTFAHGEHELVKKQAIPQNYKTKLCEKFHGPAHNCSYGQRCTFLHSFKPSPKKMAKKTRQQNLTTIVEQLSKQSDTDSDKASCLDPPVLDTQSIQEQETAFQDISDQVVNAQKLFKRFGRRLTVFSSLLHQKSLQQPFEVGSTLPSQQVQVPRP